jgi:hypothetical protein
VDNVTTISEDSRLELVATLLRVGRSSFDGHEYFVKLLPFFTPGQNYDFVDHGSGNRTGSVAMVAAAVFFPGDPR